MDLHFPHWCVRHRNVVALTIYKVTCLGNKVMESSGLHLVFLYTVTEAFTLMEAHNVLMNTMHTVLMNTKQKP